MLPAGVLLLCGGREALLGVELPTAPAMLLIEEYPCALPLLVVASAGAAWARADDEDDGLP